MKLFIVGMAAIFSTTISFAQKNNPQNQVGVDFATSLLTIKGDFENNRTSTFDELTVAKYSSSLPLGIKANFENVTAIVERLKSADYNFDNSLDSSSLSSFSKGILLQIVKNPNHLDKTAYLEDITLKVGLINKSSISADEKKLMLSLAATVYHVVGAEMAPTFTTKTRSQCWGSGPDGSGPVDCVIVGIIGGAVIGSAICGFWPCGVIGGIVGGIVGGLT